MDADFNALTHSYVRAARNVASNAYNHGKHWGPAFRNATLVYADACGERCYRTQPIALYVVVMVLLVRWVLRGPRDTVVATMYLPFTLTDRSA